jgi:diguanylate cyclase (GGDEF)-like protein/PAS domain S-box-containing protein
MHDGQGKGEKCYTLQWKDQLRNLASEKAAEEQSVNPAENIVQDQLVEELRLHQIELEMQNSELIEAQERLEASRQKYFQLFDLAPIGYMVLDLKGIFLEVNLAAAEMLGQNRMSLTKNNSGLITFLKDDSISTFKNHIKKVINELTPQECRVTLKNSATSEETIISLSSTLVDKNATSPGHIFSSLTNITELVTTQNALKESEKRFRELFENQLSGVVVFSNQNKYGDFIVSDINPAGCLLAKRSRENLVGRNVITAFPDFAKTGLHLTISQVWHSAQAESVKNYYYSDNHNSYWADYYFFKLPSGEVVAIIEDITIRRKAEKAIEGSMEWYRTVAEDIPALVCRLNPDETYTFANNAYCDMFGLNCEKIVGKSHHIVIPPEFRPGISASLHELTKESPISKNEHYNISQALGLRWLRWTNRAMFNSEGNISEYICIGEDITEQKKNYENLQISETLKSSIIEAIPDIIIRYNQEGRYLDIFTHDENKLYKPCEMILNLTVNDVLPPEVAKIAKRGINMALNSDKVHTEEYSLQTPDGELTFEARFRACGTDAVVALIRDVTEARLNEKQLQFMSMHDLLTGIYNRNYFEEELKRYDGSRDYPITVISADVDGLKLVNDTLGHGRGDSLLVSAAKVIRKNLRSSDILARVGGDEFAALLPQTDTETGEAIVARINESISAYNDSHEDLPLSLSIGVATTLSQETTLDELLKKADDLMYRDKLYRSPSTRSQVVQTLLVALAERDFITEGHTRRLADLCMEIGRRASLTNSQLSDLYLLTQVHDLGKVGIPDNILFKEGPLTENEWEIMRLHPEKGYRIAISSPDLSGVADLILKHHERYDGSGYPLGLEGDNIPIECRILSIVDAFDAMTHKRPYNRVKSCEEAVEEVKRYSGYQFDPDLAAIFLDIINC